ncbi:MAG TPA: NAD(P)H-dependent oxidoreductase subunit E [Actinomycetota bacterium]|nr:NAD(P)H-dependent oxidoreductase subunit E [Actinomycetota bacterium]
MSILTPELREQADAIVAKYPNSRSAVLPLLFLVQSVEGYVTNAGMKEVADILELTPAQVLASASFYTMLKKKPQGEYLVSVCRNIACTHLGGREVIAALEDRLEVKAGGTTADGKFSLEAAECLATCDGAPSLQINYEDFYKKDPEAAIELIDRISRGEEVVSERGEPVKTSREISLEVARAGLHLPQGEVENLRTIGGETPRADTAPGFRPKEKGHMRSDDGDS